MSIIVNDDGFAPDHWQGGFLDADNLEQLSVAEKTAQAVQFENTLDVDTLIPYFDQIDMIRLQSPVFSDGRAFSQARRLRMLGFVGRLRLCGHVLADQYAMARRSGFDEVEISDEMAVRQPQSQWQARADWQKNDYQQRMRQFGG